MPVMDGYTAAGQMRQWEHERDGRRTPILALTAHALQEEIRRSLQAGCDAHLTKPIMKATLIEAINKWAIRDAAEPLRVVVDSSLEDIIPGFLENRRKGVTTLQQALEREDFYTLRVQGHNMKGSGASYGFPALTELGTAIEEAAKNEDSGSIREGIAELVGFLESVTVVYK